MPRLKAPLPPANDFRQVTMADSAAKFTPPASPTASFYDLSDDEEGEYNTIMHSSSGRGVKLLYSKSKVYTTSSTHSVYKRLTSGVLGLCTSYTLIQRQHTWLHSPHTAKEPHQQRATWNQLLRLLESRPSYIIFTSLATRILTRGCLRLLCQG